MSNEIIYLIDYHLKKPRDLPDEFSVSKYKKLIIFQDELLYAFYDDALY